mmetsp:Transcript_3428/g.9076  ORF Transcript_3428/g.9076 Transcript_3428/m.9076 type:complete len:218 (+) Transcript_3428:1626-2279(+)
MSNRPIIVIARHLRGINRCMVAKTIDNGAHIRCAHFVNRSEWRCIPCIDIIEGHMLLRFVHTPSTMVLLANTRQLSAMQVRRNSGFGDSRCLLSQILWFRGITMATTTVVVATVRLLSLSHISRRLLGRQVRRFVRLRLRSMKMWVVLTRRNSISICSGSRQVYSSTIMSKMNVPNNRSHRSIHDSALGIGMVSRNVGMHSSRSTAVRCGRRKSARL